MQRFDIELLFAPGCTSRQETRAIVEEIVTDKGLSAEIRETEVTTSERASDLRFLGSPSIRVNGKDIDPEAVDRDDFGMG